MIGIGMITLGTVLAPIPDMSQNKKSVSRRIEARLYRNNLLISSWLP